jgi:hypothetical protein
MFEPGTLWQQKKNLTAYATTGSGQVQINAEKLFLSTQG